MKAVSLFSGPGGLDLGLERAGITTVAMCEIDPHARKVLARHWPDTPIHHDVTRFDARSLHGTIDLVHGGSPCQDLSVAGRRGGLGGQRSNLFWHQCRIAAECAAPWVLWENVPGALTSNSGSDFAAVLWGLTGARPDVPAEGFRGMGLLVGATRVAVWRILDARWFGVAQRRRRVFVVSGPRTELRRAIQVLLEPESSPRGAQPSAAQGQEVAGTLGGGTPGRGWSDDTDRMTFVPVRRLAHGHYVEDDETWAERDVAPTLNAMDNGGETRATVLVPMTFGWQNAPAQGEDIVTDGVASLRANTTPAVLTQSAYPLAMRGRSDGAHLEMGEADVYNALRAGDGGSSRQNAVLTPDLAVRRLMPVETERLMGWPDDHTRWDADGNEIADSHRYRLCGNGVVAPVAEWIGRRLMGAAA